MQSNLAAADNRAQTEIYTIPFHVGQDEYMTRSMKIYRNRINNLQGDCDAIQNKTDKSNDQLTKQMDQLLDLNDTLQKSCDHYQALMKQHACSPEGSVIMDKILELFDELDHFTEREKSKAFDSINELKRRHRAVQTVSDVITAFQNLNKAKEDDNQNNSVVEQDKDDGQNTLNSPEDWTQELDYAEDVEDNSTEENEDEQNKVNTSEQDDGVDSGMGPDDNDKDNFTKNQTPRSEFVLFAYYWMRHYEEIYSSETVTPSATLQSPLLREMRALDECGELPVTGKSRLSSFDGLCELFALSQSSDECRSGSDECQTPPAPVPMLLDMSEISEWNYTEESTSSAEVVECTPVISSEPEQFSKDQLIAPHMVRSRSFQNLAILQSSQHESSILPNVVDNIPDVVQNENTSEHHLEGEFEYVYEQNVQPIQTGQDSMTNYIEEGTQRNSAAIDMEVQQLTQLFLFNTLNNMLNISTNYNEQHIASTDNDITEVEQLPTIGQSDIAGTQQLSSSESSNVVQVQQLQDLEVVDIYQTN